MPELQLSIVTKERRLPSIARTIITRLISLFCFVFVLCVHIKPSFLLDKELYILGYNTVSGRVPHCVRVLPPASSICLIMLAATTTIKRLHIGQADTILIWPTSTRAREDARATCQALHGAKQKAIRLWFHIHGSASHYSCTSTASACATAMSCVPCCLLTAIIYAFEPCLSQSLCVGAPLYVCVCLRVCVCAHNFAY